MTNHPSAHSPRHNSDELQKLVTPPTQVNTSKLRIVSETERRRTPSGISVMDDRAYPPIASFDTVIGDNGRRIGDHDVGNTKLFSDDSIFGVVASWKNWETGVTKEAKKYTIGQQEAGAFYLATGSGVVPIWVEKNGLSLRHLIPQQAQRSCAFAAGAMILLDHCSKQHIVALRSVKIFEDIILDSLSNTKGLIDSLDSALGKTGYKAFSSKLSCDQDLLARQLKQGGSAILKIGGEIGGHVIVIDAIENTSSRFRVRDPFHGWDIEVRFKSLKARVYPPYFEIVQICESGEKLRTQPFSLRERIFNSLKRLTDRT